MKWILFLAMLGSVTLSHAHEFAPKNDRKIPVGDVSANDMNEETFNKVIDHVFKRYEAIIKDLGGVLKIKKLWKDNTVNAYAQRIGSTYLVTMFGGLARHKDVTPDGFALVVCHEIGHHIGGAPKYSGNNWASTEGQSDYWGAMNCAKRIFENFDNVKYVQKRIRKARKLRAQGKRRKASKILSEYALGKCTDAYKGKKEDIALCYRIAMAGQSLANLLADLRGVKYPNFETPDPTKVGKSFPRHPKPQCRLDTYFQGALCNIAYDKDVDQKDPFLNTCARKDGKTIGVRPNCWFNENDDFGLRRKNEKRNINNRIFL